MWFVEVLLIYSLGYAARRSWRAPAWPGVDMARAWAAGDRWRFADASPAVKTALEAALKQLPAEAGRVVGS